MCICKCEPSNHVECTYDCWKCGHWIKLSSLLLIRQSISFLFLLLITPTMDIWCWCCVLWYSCSWNFYSTYLNRLLFIWIRHHLSNYSKYHITLPMIWALYLAQRQMSGFDPTKVLIPIDHLIWVCRFVDTSFAPFATYIRLTCIRQFHVG